MKNNKMVLRRLGEICVLAVLLGAVATTVWVLAPAPIRGSERSAATYQDVTAELRGQTISIGGSQVFGSSDASLAVVTFTDFECSFCGAFARDTWPSVAERYVKTNRVVLVFKHMPLNSIHVFAETAASAAECAGRQGRFWEFHDSLFAETGGLDRASLGRVATRVGTDEGTFDACMAQGTSLQVHQDLADAKRLGIRGTPTFLIGHRDSEARVRVAAAFSGSVPADEFGRILERLAGQR